MNAKEIKELAEKVSNTQEQNDKREMIERGLHIKNVKLDFADETNSCYQGGRLNAFCCQVIKENSAKIIEEAKLRMNKQLIEQTEELKRATLEYATGFKVN